MEAMCSPKRLFTFNGLESVITQMTVSVRKGRYETLISYGHHDTPLPSEHLGHRAGHNTFNISWNRRFILEFTQAQHWSLSWARWIQPIPSYPIYLLGIPVFRNFWISPYRICLVLNPKLLLLAPGSVVPTSGDRSARVHRLHSLPCGGQPITFQHTVGRFMRVYGLLSSGRWGRGKLERELHPRICFVALTCLGA
jgi:hypothetical protein